MASLLPSFLTASSKELQYKLIRIEDWFAKDQLKSSAETSHYTIIPKSENAIQHRPYAEYRRSPAPTRQDTFFTRLSSLFFPGIAKEEAPVSSSQSSCYLLRLPLELRQLIWSYLVPRNQTIHIVRTLYDVSAQQSRPDFYVYGMSFYAEESGETIWPRRLGTLSAESWDLFYLSHSLDQYLPASPTCPLFNDALPLACTCRQL